MHRPNFSSIGLSRGTGVEGSYLADLSELELSPSHSDSGFLHGEQLDHKTSDDQNESRFPAKRPLIKSELSSHIYTRALLEGKYSDVTVKVFDVEYKLHRLLLDRSGYFNSLFNWNSANEEDEDEDQIVRNDSLYSISFDDEYITKDSFDLALSRLYGEANYELERKIPHNMIATASYLDIQDIIVSCTDAIVHIMDMSNVVMFLKFATTNHYGQASEKIIDAAKVLLCCSGWEYGAAQWDEIAESIICDVVGEDCFFVPTEWDRCMFIIKLIERRTLIEELPLDNDDISTLSSLRDSTTSLLRQVLQDKIHYCHLTAEQLQQLSDFNDINGDPYIESSVLHQALWQSATLQRSIVRSPDVPNLGLCVTSEDESLGEDKGWYRVPVRDETICGTPKTLKKLISEHQYSVSTLDSFSPVEDGDVKATAGVEGHESLTKVYSWTKYPPFRFSIAFANASDLSTEKRVYAKTLWYAGSYWNLYLQKVKVKQKKGFQVGVYLHRATTTSSSMRSGLVNPDVYLNSINYTDVPVRYTGESFHVPKVLPTEKHSLTKDTSEVKEIINEDSLLSSLDNLDISDTSKSETNYESPTSHKQFVTNVSSESSHDQKSFLYYDDTRTMISVYFVISTPSRRSKATITSFVSAPDTFNKSQSWGWKSNSMCVFNEDGTFPEDHEKHLKFMVVLGNI